MKLFDNSKVTNKGNKYEKTYLNEKYTLEMDKVIPRLSSNLPDFTEDGESYIIAQIRKSMIGEE